MTATAAPPPSAPPSGPSNALRHGSIRSMIGPGISAAYLLATWHAPARPVMLAVTAVMIAVAALTAWRAPSLAGTRARVTARSAGMVVNIVGSAALSLLDGGVASPLGALIPFSLLFYASLTPPRMFAAAGALSVVAYWTVALLGEPAPPGYAIVYTLGIGGVSLICMRHAAALKSLRRRLAEVSRRDPLTRCLNRRGLDDRLEQEIARADGPVTLVLADLDHLKQINDTYGHKAGDAVIVWTGRTLTTAVGDQDAVGRIGGDEFAVVLRDTGADEARAVLAGLRAALGDTAPASYGCATFPAEATTSEELRQLADQRLYADKQSRDRRPPSAAAVEHATTRMTGRADARVTRRERRRRSIADMGRVTASDCAVGVVYAAVFAQASPHRLLIAVLCLAGLAYGLAIVAAADRLSRWSSGDKFMVAGVVPLLGLAIAVPAMDGGVASATGVAMLAPMPMIALAVPPRIAARVLTVLITAYMAVAVLVGGAGVWYVLMHLAGVITVCIACAVQGHAAARQRTLLTRLSKVDALTESLNRRGFEERFARELAEPGRTAGLLILDLDGFKRVNDTLGHAAGDELLRWVATTLRSRLGPDGVVGRLGGDEFVVLLGQVPADDVRTVAEDLRAVLARRTAASIGTAVLGRDGDTFDALYAHADTELYAEKSSRTPARTVQPAHR